MAAPRLATHEAAALLAQAAGGAEEVLGILEGKPLLIVELDAPQALENVRLPCWFPCVVAGVGPGGQVPAGALDLALTEAPSPPRPWVEVADCKAALEDLEKAIGASPLASVVLAQLLRAHSGDLEADLLAESLAFSALQAGPEFQAWRKGRPPRKRKPAGQPVQLERQGGRLIVVLNRPEVRNAYGMAMRDALCETLANACADATVEAVELRGAGPDFCSGGDLEEFGSLPDPATAHAVRTARSAARLLGALSPRTTAYLHGACVGAGIELASTAARVVAACDTWVALPEVGMGLIPGSGGTASIPRRVGRHRTAWMALSSAKLDAVTALDWGLVDELA